MNAAEALKGARYIRLGFNRRFDPHVTGAAAEDCGRGDRRVGNADADQSRPRRRRRRRSFRARAACSRTSPSTIFDLAYCLLGEPPEIFATASCLVDPEIAELGDVDTARIILRTASNKLCVISNTRRSGYGYDQRVEAYGSKGMAATGNERLDAVEVWSEAGALRLADPAELPQPLHALLRARNGPLRRRAGRQARRRQVGYAEGLAALALG